MTTRTKLTVAIVAICFIVSAVLLHGQATYVTGATGTFITNAATRLRMTATNLLGRTSAGTGPIQEIAIGSGLVMTNQTLAATGGGGTTINSTDGVIPVRGDATTFIDSGITATNSTAKFSGSVVAIGTADVDEGTGLYAVYNLSSNTPVAFNGRYETIVSGANGDTSFVNYGDFIEIYQDDAATNSMSALFGHASSLGWNSTGDITFMYGGSFTVTGQSGTASDDMVGVFGLSTIDGISAADHVVGAFGEISLLSGTASSDRKAGVLGFVKVDGGAWDNVSSLYSDASLLSGTVTNLHSAWLRQPSSGSIKTNYGIRIDDVLAGSSNNYAIYSGSGIVKFGDAIVSIRSGNTNFYAAASSGYTGGGTNFLSDDGTYKVPAIIGQSGSVTNNGISWTVGSGSPEGAIIAPIGSFYSRTDGSTNTTWYVKVSGAGNTGWVAK